MDFSQYHPKPGKKINLADFPTRTKDGWEKRDAKEATDGLQERLITLQEMLYAQSEQSLLIVLQAMDAGGKDSTIKHVFGGVNPQGVKVHGFKKPSEVELSHDFLWRVHQVTPAKGMIAIFNRSHYEDVLVARVNTLVPESVWKKRYAHINNFEQLLADNGTKILKFYLHISKEEQRERFQDRLDRPDKNWKFSIGDLPVRERWSEYMQAFEDAISKCNTDVAPWYIVPADRKWFRNLLISQVIVDTLESMNLAYPEPEEGLDQVVIPD